MSITGTIKRMFRRASRRSSSSLRRGSRILRFRSSSKLALSTRSLVSENSESRHEYVPRAAEPNARQKQSSDEEAGDGILVLERIAQTQFTGNAMLPAATIPYPDTYDVDQSFVESPQNAEDSPASETDPMISSSDDDGNADDGNADDGNADDGNVDDGNTDDVNITRNDKQSDDKGQEEHGKETSSFLGFFLSSNGPPQVILISLFLALVLGSTVGIIPAIMSDRYARLEHGFQGEDCATYSRMEKPQECLAGSADAMNAAAYTSFVSNGFTFFTSCLVGSISDERGRRALMLIGIFLSTISPLCLVLIQLIDTMSPTWYYAAHCLGGLINWMSIALAALSDVVPKKWRAASFGLLLASFMMGFAFAPMLALGLGHLGVSIMSFSLLVVAFVFAVFFLPETLPPESAKKAVQVRQKKTSGRSRWVSILIRPITDLLILNRSRLFRLLSALAFFSGMSSAGDQSLFLYYVEERLEFNDTDVAVVFLLLGGLGIVVQGGLLKPLNDCLGERLVIFVAFVIGAVHNAMYGLATTKTAIFVALGLGSMTALSFPTISAIKANNADEHEQGRIQGALYSLSSLASAVGPMAMRLVYQHTIDSPYPGPGYMFIFSASLYMVAAICAYALPKDQANSKSRHKLNNDTSSKESYGSIV